MLGISAIPALDVRAQCSGFIYALSVADAWIAADSIADSGGGSGDPIHRAGRVQRADARRGHLRRRRRRAVPGPGEENNGGILAFDLHSEGAHAEKLWVDARDPCTTRACLTSRSSRTALPGDGRQGGLSPRRSAHARIGARRAAAAGHTVEELDLLLAHQANLRISEVMQKDLGLRDDQVYNNIMRYGNTTAATIP